MRPVSSARPNRPLINRDYFLAAAISHDQKKTASAAETGHILINRKIVFVSLMGSVRNRNIRTPEVFPDRPGRNWGEFGFYRV